MRAAKTAVSHPPESPTSVPGPVPVPTRAELIDEYGEIDRELKLIEPKRKRLEELKVIIRAWYDQFPAERTFEEEGRLYKLVLSPREMEATPDIKEIFKRCLDTTPKVIQALYARWGEKLIRFFELVSVSQKVIRERWGDKAVEEVFRRERTGSRKLTVVAKAGPSA